MVNRPEDRPKVIALGVCIVGFGAYFFIGVLPGMVHKPQSETPAPPPPTAAAAGQTGTAAPTVPPIPGAPDLYADVGVPGAPGSDPFNRPPGIIDPLAPQQQPQGHPSPVAMHGPTGLIPGSGFGTTGLHLAPVGGNGTPQGVFLQGVVVGGDPVAVVRVGTDVLTRRPGQELMPGVWLVRVLELGAVIRIGKQTMTLDVGHGIGGETPQAPGTPGAAGTPIPAAGAPAPAPAAGAARPGGNASLPGFGDHIALRQYVPLGTDTGETVASAADTAEGIGTGRGHG